MKNKHIVCLIDNLGSGGAQRQLVNLGILIKNIGYKVSFITYQDNMFYKDFLDRENIPLICVESGNYISRIINIRKALKESNADVVIAFLEVPGFIACLSKMSGLKFKLVTNELSASEYTFINKRNRIFNIFERYSDAKVCNSENAMGMWQKYYPQYNDKYQVIYNPVIIPDNLINHKCESTNKKLNLIVAASYQELKNPIRLVEAVNGLSRSDQEKIKIDWFGRKEAVIGSDEYYNKVEKLVEQYNLQDCINLHDETKQIYEHMNNADVVGLFSTVEGLPNAICEGMMLGKPIIMSKVSDYRTLTDGNGITCDANSVESIREALKTIIDMPEKELLKMGEISRQKAERLFSVNEIVEKWHNLIEGLLQK